MRESAETPEPAPVKLTTMRVIRPFDTQSTTVNRLIGGWAAELLLKLMPANAFVNEIAFS